MNRDTPLTHEFVEFIPGELDERTVYVSIRYATSVHKCLCGCGNKVVTPIGPTDWKLIFDGDSISLDPSVGNWSFRCQSHYWIKRNRVVWAGRMSDEDIAAGRENDRRAKQGYFRAARDAASARAGKVAAGKSSARPQKVWQTIKSWFGRLWNSGM